MRVCVLAMALPSATTCRPLPAAWRGVAWRGVQVCFSEVEPGEMTCMDCGHGFCNSCWQQHIVTQIGEGQARTLR